MIPQTRKNLYTNIANLVVNIVVGIYYTPYLVNQLGLAAYGIIPLTLIVNQYISVLTGSLTSALSRFYTIYIQKENFAKASEVISTSLIAIFVLILFIVPFFIWLVIDLDLVFNIPKQLQQAAQLLFIFTGGSFFVSLISSSLNISLYAYNRLDLMNVITLTRIGFKFLLVIVFFESIEVNIIFVGLSNLCTELLVLILNIYFFLRQTKKKVKFGLSYFVRTTLVSILGMAVWTVIHQLGDVAIYRVDNIIVNQYWGTELSGALGAVSEFGVYVSLVVGVISSLFGPIILIAYSKQNHDEVQKLTMNDSLIVGVLSASIVGSLIGYSVPILEIWLGKEFVVYNSWLILKMLSLPFFSAAGIYAYVNRSWNKVKYPALFTDVLGVINIIGLILISEKSTIDTMSVIKLMLFFSVFIIIVQSYGVNAFFFNRIYPGNAGQIKFVFLKICISICVSICSSTILLKVYQPKNLVELVLVLSITILISVLISVLTLFSTQQRLFIFSIIK